MSRKSCKRKHWARVNPIQLALEGCSITPEAALDKLRLRELSAIESFSKGTATPSEFRDLCDVLNLAQTMGEMGIGPEVLPVCAKVQANLLICQADFHHKGLMRFGPAELAAARDLYEYHDTQRTSVDRSTYEFAIQRTLNRIRSSHPSLRVLT